MKIINYIIKQDSIQIFTEDGKTSFIRSNSIDYNELKNNLLNGIMEFQKSENAEYLNKDFFKKIDGEYVYKTKSLQVTLGLVVIENLKRYYDCDVLYNRYIDVLLNNPILFSMEEGTIITFGSKSSQSSVIANISKESMSISYTKKGEIPHTYIHLDLPELGLNRGAFNYMSGAPYIPEQGVLDESHLNNLKFLLNFLENFWHKNIDDIPKIDKSITDNFLIQSKFIEKVLEKFSLEDGIAQSVIDHSTDLQYLSSLMIAGLIKVKD